MFTQHPKHSEFFDVEVFIEENISILHDLYKQAMEQLEQLNNPEAMEEVDISASVLLATAVYEDTNTITLPLEYETEDYEGICDLASELVVLVNLFILEDKGFLKRNNNRWSITKEGAIGIPAYRKEVIERLGDPSLDSYDDDIFEEELDEEDDYEFVDEEDAYEFLDFRDEDEYFFDGTEESEDSVG